MQHSNYQLFISLTRYNAWIEQIHRCQWSFIQFNILSLGMEQIVKVQPKDSYLKIPQKKLKGKVFAKWNQEENKAYISFIGKYRAELSSEYYRRSAKVFHHMAMHVKSRNAEQCRTHHQKMIQGYGPIDSIIEKIKNKKYRKPSKKSILKSNLIPEIPQASVMSQLIKKQQEEPVVMTNVSFTKPRQHFEVSNFKGQQLCIYVEWQQIDKM